jgi:hypothetical protein
MPVSESGTTEPPATDPAVTEPVVTEPVVTEEVRLLEGPNLYFTKPAVKVMLSMPGYLEAPTTSVKAVADALGMRARVGEPGSVQRVRSSVALRNSRFGRSPGRRAPPGWVCECVLGPPPRTSSWQPYGAAAAAPGSSASPWRAS